MSHCHSYRPKEKLEKLESRKRKPRTYEDDKAKLQAAIVKVKKLVERYQPKSQSTWKGIDIADAGAIALKIDKETKEKETGAAIGNVVNQEITRLMDPEAERIAAEKRQALEQQGHKQPPKPPPAEGGALPMPMAEGGAMPMMPIHESGAKPKMQMHD